MPAWKCSWLLTFEERELINILLDPFSLMWPFYLLIIIQLVDFTAGRSFGPSCVCSLPPPDTRPSLMLRHWWLGGTGAVGSLWLCSKPLAE